MTLWHCIAREIAHRKLNFALSLAGALVAVLCVLGLSLTLDDFDHRAAAALAEHRAEVEERGRLLNDDMRKITKGLGFNILILPQGQNLGDVYAEGYASQTMPEEYVTTLAAAPIVTVDHLLPSLEQKLEWPEQKRTIVLVGIRGEVPRLRGEAKKPLLDPVPPNQIVLGYELHHSLGLGEGDELTLLGRTFTVAGCYGQRGNKDDITAWINLDEAQQLLDKPGLINAIWALECNCATIDRLAEIRSEIATILPNTQVIEIATQATARAEARKKAEKLAIEALQQAEAQQTADRRRIAWLIAVAVPSSLVGSGLWIFVLAWLNVRDRRSEIGILRAIGFRASQILSIFLGKAILTGLIGAALGCLLAWLVGSWWLGERSVAGGAVAPIMGVVLVGAPLLAAVASWLPALVAALQDPASVLCEE